MIKGKGRKDVILVQCEQYDWGRYLAYLPSLLTDDERIDRSFDIFEERMLGINKN